jgi:hypothetical protein
MIVSFFQMEKNVSLYIDLDVMIFCMNKHEYLYIPCLVAAEGVQRPFYCNKCSLSTS